MSNSIFVPTDALTPVKTSPSPTTTSIISPSSSHGNTGLIAGGVVGGLVLVGMILGLIWYRTGMCRRRDYSKTPLEQNNATSAMLEVGQRDDARDTCDEVRVG